MSVRVVCISDTHNYHKSVKLPKGDVLVHAGDSTSMGRKHEIEAFGKWVASQTSFSHKLIISGNHDFGFQKDPDAVSWFYGNVDDHSNGVYYLQDNGATINVKGQELKVYGSPWQPWFHNWAFNLATAKELEEKWNLIPDGLDILITHGPARGLLDRTLRGEEVGCTELRKALARAQPKLHVCGHIHEDRGVTRYHNTVIANASICTLEYNPDNKPLVFDFHEDGTVEQVFDELKV